MNVLTIKNLSKSFIGIQDRKRRYSFKSALKDININIRRGEIFALIGETGSGKSTLAKCIVRILRADDGKIYFDNKEILQLSEKDFRSVRPKIQMIYQNSLLAFNPRKRIYNALSEPLKRIRKFDGINLQQYLGELINMVELDYDLLFRFPHELSGGQLQRVAIARALTTEPAIVIADEPASSLDAIHKNQILFLFKKIRSQKNLSILLITHDLNLVAKIADRIAVLVDGQIIEVLKGSKKFLKVFHPYTRNLINSINLNSTLFQLNKSNFDFDPIIQSQSPGKGCVSIAQCHCSTSQCAELVPELAEVSESHLVACHFPEKILNSD
jgi:ABC-type oligopeptide transport system ATPase subunit